MQNDNTYRAGANEKSKTFKIYVKLKYAFVLLHQLRLRQEEDLKDNIVVELD